MQAALAAGNAAGQRCAANLMVRSAVQSSLHSEREGLLSEVQCMLPAYKSDRPVQCILVAYKSA